MIMIPTMIMMMTMILFMILVVIITGRFSLSLSRSKGRKGERDNHREVLSLSLSLSRFKGRKGERLQGWGEIILSFKTMLMMIQGVFVTDVVFRTILVDLKWHVLINKRAAHPHPLFHLVSVSASAYPTSGTTKGNIALGRVVQSWPG